MDEGFVKIYRKMMDSAEWMSFPPEHFKVMITCLLLANHRKNKWFFKGQSYSVRPGQFITSYNSLAEKCGEGVSVRNVRTAIKNLQLTQFLTWEATKRNSLVTICKWGDYQKKGARPDMMIDTGTDTHPTHTRHTPDTHLTSNKNDKNDKNERNIKREGDFFQKNGGSNKSPKMLPHGRNYLN